MAGLVRGEDPQAAADKRTLRPSPHWESTRDRPYQRTAPTDAPHQRACCRFENGLAVHETIPTDQRADVATFTGSCGEAGAVDVLGSAPVPPSWFVCVISTPSSANASNSDASTHGRVNGSPTPPTRNTRRFMSPEPRQPEKLDSRKKSCHIHYGRRH